MIYDRRPCDLGEGPLWHPVREQLFWFDITGQRMLSVQRGSPREWRFPEMVSAAGWLSRDVLLIAGERDLFLFDVETEETETLTELEADNRITRSNDGRADPLGGFWIGTMGKQAEPGAGAIYRYFDGELRKLFNGISIPNAICFSPDGRVAHFADTATGRVMRVALDATGWPLGTPEVFVDLGADGGSPDGAVTDADGVLWLAVWGGGCLQAYAPDGQMLRQQDFAAPHLTCPAFGGAGFGTLFCTSALQGMDAAARGATPAAGMTFMVEGLARGRAEPQILL
ncbi:MAG: SMP-30/gluconolactonase/LRE family protein [Gemmobacter sp.]|nr:SMP-30/gluconolactonase/LRE family protein [Gemmobacter sp.]